MAGTVATDLAFFSGATGGVSDCETITDWSGTPAQVAEEQVQGTYCLSEKVSNTTMSILFTVAGTVNLVGKQIFIWVRGLRKTQWDLKANGGIQIEVQDAAANYRRWYVAGRDTIPHGGWICHTVRTDQTPNEQSTTPADLSAIKKVGIRVKTVVTSTKDNVFWDALRYGTYIQIKGGTPADPAKFQDIMDTEEIVTNQYGIMSKVEGVYYLQSPLIIGSTISGEATYFKDTSQVVVFRDALVGSDYFEILIQGNSGTFTKVYFGDESGESGISGVVFRSAGAAKFKLTATDVNITELGLYGCSFFDAGTIQVPNTFTVYHEVENASFEKGGMISANVCKFNACNFISADLRAVHLPLNHNVTNSQFINNPRAIYVTEPGTITLDNLKFSGNTYDIEFTGGTGSTLYVSNINGSNPSEEKLYTPNGGTIEFLPTQVLLKVYVTDELGDPIDNAQVAIFLAESPYTQLMNEDTVGGLAQETYSYTTDKNVIVKVRKSSPGTQRYVATRIPAVIGSNGLTLYVTLQKDQIASSG